MALSGKFNGQAFDENEAEAAASAEPGFNPFAANVHLTQAHALKLAALEERGGSGIIRRVTAGEGGRGFEGGSSDRRAARAGDALMQMALTAQQWDAQLVTVGGVTMTNAEAQAARRRILENPDHYIAWAKERGLIRDGEEQALIDTGREITELKELERGGRLKPEQKERMEALERSRLGRVFDQATGQAHRETRYELDQKAQAGESVGAPAQADALFDRMTAHASQAPPQEPVASPVDDPVFASAPSLKSGFAAGLKATEPLDRPRAAPATNETPGGPDRTAAASGLDL